MVEEVAVTIPFPKQTRSTSGFTVNMGTVIYDEAGKVARWTLGKMDISKKASLSCSFTMLADDDEQGDSSSTPFATASKPPAIFARHYRGSTAVP